MLSNQLSSCLDSFNIISSSRNKLLSTISSPNVKENSVSRIPLTPSEFAIGNYKEELNEFSPKAEQYLNKENRNNSNFTIGKAKSIQSSNRITSSTQDLKISQGNEYSRAMPSRSLHYKEGQRIKIRPQVNIRTSETDSLPLNKRTQTNKDLNTNEDKLDYANLQKARPSLNPSTLTQGKNIMLKDLLIIKQEIIERQNRLETEMNVVNKKPKMPIHELCIPKNMHTSRVTNRNQNISLIKGVEKKGLKQKCWIQRKRKDTPKLQQKVLPDESLPHCILSL